MFSTEFFDGVDAFFDGSRQPVTPRFIGITDDLFCHHSLDRGHWRILSVRCDDHSLLMAMYGG
jgi:hypothetical protein